MTTPTREKVARNLFHEWDKECCTNTAPTYFECWKAARADLEATIAEQSAEIERLGRWKNAVENELVICGIINDSHTDPEKALSDAIQWNIEVSNDPLVSQIAKDRQLEVIAQQAHIERLKKVLETTHELYSHVSAGYGFARPDNPHNFWPDIECCSIEEIKAHSKACSDYDAGNPIAADSWGVGAYCEEFDEAVKALAIQSSTDALREHDAKLVERIAQTVQPEDSYQDEWFKAKADCYKRVMEIADKIRKGDWK